MLTSDCDYENGCEIWGCDWPSENDQGEDGACFYGVNSGESDYGRNGLMTARRCGVCLIHCYVVLTCDQG